MLIGSPENRVNSHTKLFLPGENLFDQSLGGKAITNVGGVTVVDAPGGHPYARSAGYIPGTAGDYAYTPSSSDFSFFGNTFAVEYWVFPTGATGHICSIGNANHCTLYMGSATTASLYLNGASVATVTLTSNAWQFVQIIYDGANTKVYVGAVQSGVTVSGGVTVDLSRIVYVGGASGGASITGYIADLRISTGVVRTPGVPTAPLVADAYTKLLLPMDMGVDRVAKDTSGTNKALTIGSTCKLSNVYGQIGIAHDNAATGGLSTPNHADFDFGTGDFTVEGVFYLTQRTAYNFLMGCCDFSGTNGWCITTTTTNGYLRFDYAGTSYSTTYVVPLNQLLHIAVVKDSTSNIRLYVAGVQVGSVSSAATNSSSKVFSLGVDTSGSYRLVNGQSMWANIVKGTCLYPNGTTFTPPSGPIVHANTKLCVVPGSDPRSFLDYSSSPKTITRNGSAVQAMLPPGKKVLNFSGSGQYLTSANSADFDMLLGDFTIDAMVRPAATVVGAAVYSRNSAGTGTNGRMALFHQTSGSWANWISSAGSTWDVINGTTCGTVDIGVFQHLAIVRSGSSFYFFKNGVLQNTITSSLSIAGISATVAIGLWNSSVYFNGNIQSFRIAKFARWTKNFIPPRKPY